MSTVDRDFRDYCDSCSGVYPPEELDGIWVEHWPNGQLKFRGEFRKRCMRVGQHISFFSNGVLQELAYWDNGWVSGTLIWFRDDGTKEYEKDYGEHGGRTRCWTEKYYSATGQIAVTRVYRSDKVVAESTNSEIRQVWGQIDADSIIQDAIEKYFPPEI